MRIGFLSLLLAGCGQAGSECVSAEALDVLGRHLEQIDAAVTLMAETPSATEGVSMLLVPGLDAEMQTVAVDPPCAAVEDREPSCDPDTKLCTRIRCLGLGAGWTVETWAETPLERNGFRFDSARTDVTWADGQQGFRWTLASAGASPDGLDVSAIGEGALVTDGPGPLAWTLTETLPGLLEGGEAELTVTEPGPVGDLTLDGVEVATFDQDLQPAATGACPTLP